jgi:membrane protein YdbS with pleckstrin-like domain
MLNYKLRIMENHNTSSSVSYTGVLTLIFVVLKLCNVINWSWWWVFCPIWISFVLGAFLIIILGIIVVYLVLLQYLRYIMNTRG